VRFLVILIVLQTAAEVVPSVFSGIPWTQPQAMRYGGFVLIAVLAVLAIRWFLARRPSR
jgi:hypothetical protein